jgi:hypothetical protein
MTIVAGDLSQLQDDILSQVFPIFRLRLALKPFSDLGILVPV